MVEVLGDVVTRRIRRDVLLHERAQHVLRRQATVEDPNVWETPWKIPPRTFQRRPEENVTEFVCESSVDYQRLFKK